MSRTVNPTEVQGVATRRVQRLRSLAFAEIATLPERQDEIEQVGDREISVATYRDTLPNGHVRIVVQAYFPRFLGIGTMTADGFLIAPDDTKSPVPEEMMWDFV